MGREFQEESKSSAVKQADQQQLSPMCNSRGEQCAGNQAGQLNATAVLDEQLFQWIHGFSGGQIFHHTTGNSLKYSVLRGNATVINSLWCGVQNRWIFVVIQPIMRLRFRMTFRVCWMSVSELMLMFQAALNPLHGNPEMIVCLMLIIVGALCNSKSIRENYSTANGLHSLPTSKNDTSWWSMPS
jgi:hypothetical protein